MHPHSNDTENTMEPLIRMEGIKKVFYTDEVETHALVGRPLRDRQRRLLVDRGPVGLRQVDAAVDPRPARYADGRQVLAERQARREPDASQRAHIRNQRDRLHLPGVQPDRRSHGVRERRAAADVSRHDAAERKKRVLEALERVRHGASLEALSVAALGRSAAARRRGACDRGGNPSILLADEPTGNLDSKNGEAVMELLRELHADGATICMVTHDPRYARYADRKIHMFDGQVVDDAVVTH